MLEGAVGIGAGGMGGFVGIGIGIGVGRARCGRGGTGAVLYFTGSRDGDERVVIAMSLLLCSVIVLLSCSLSYFFVTSFSL